MNPSASIIKIALVPFVFLFGSYMAQITNPKYDINPPECGITMTGLTGLPNCSRTHQGIKTGQRTSIDRFPWQIQITTLSNQNVCGGSILNSKYILTAAHCFNKKQHHPSQVRVHVGVTNPDDLTGKSGLEILRIITHQGYLKHNFTHDIALIELAQPLEEYNQNMRPVCLPTAQMMPSPLQEQSDIYVSGYGVTTENKRESGTLHAVCILKKNRENCGYHIKKKMAITVTENMFCAGYYNERKDTCQGDSGGPVVHKDQHTGKFVQDGIVSFGYGCGLGFPGVYTKVSRYVDWIREQMQFEQNQQNYQTLNTKFPRNFATILRQTLNKRQLSQSKIGHELA